MPENGEVHDKVLKYQGLLVEDFISAGHQTMDTL
jgi:hypothetical protein